MAEQKLLDVRYLKKYFPIKTGIFRVTTAHVRAVDGVSFSIKKGETLGLVGESGCGKTTVGRTILRLIKATSGAILFGDQDLLNLSRRDLRGIRKNIQIIFQDPYASLNRRLTVGEIVGEALDIHHLAENRKQRREKIEEILAKVGMRAEIMRKYPHEFSGGQRQRIGIARALSVEPKLIIADEPLSSLDVSIQAQVINLLQDLQESMNLTYLFISHDLSVVRHISNRIAVMYLGKIVEMAEKRDLFQTPLHPYTESLLSAIPIPDPLLKRKRILLEGDVPSPVNPPPGCHFHTRCPKVMAICRKEEPELKDFGGGHLASCHLY
ncbi:MAG TPA: dipeptide ABC transporter ATP-binding protein [Spirochaetia bacterium]|nr:dipeptide ABC transporter ATP-binding protein [Spirochaetia bacterium]